MTKKERTDAMLKIAYAAGRELAFQEFEKEAQGYQAPMRPERPLPASLFRGPAPGQFTAPGTKFAPSGELQKKPQPTRIAGRMASSTGQFGQLRPLQQPQKPKMPSPVAGR